MKSPTRKVIIIQRTGPQTAQLGFLSCSSDPLKDKVCVVYGIKRSRNRGIVRSVNIGSIWSSCIRRSNRITLVVLATAVKEVVSVASVVVEVVVLVVAN